MNTRACLYAAVLLACTGWVPASGAVPFRLDQRLAKLLEVRDCTDDFAWEVQRALLAIPASIRAKLEAGGMKVVVGKEVVGVDPALKGRQPRGYSPGSTFAHSSGVCCTDTRQMIVGEYYRRGPLLVRNQNAEAVVRHECGHGLDHVLTGYSNSQRFVDAYNADKEDIPADVQQELAYHLQEGSAGRCELFADLFALTLGGPAVEEHRASLHRYFPRARALVERLVYRLQDEADSDTGGAESRSPLSKTRQAIPQGAHELVRWLTADGNPLLVLAWAAVAGFAAWAIALLFRKQRATDLETTHHAYQVSYFYSLPNGVSGFGNHRLYSDTEELTFEIAESMLGHIRQLLHSNGLEGAFPVILSWQRVPGSDIVRPLTAGLDAGQAA